MTLTAPPLQRVAPPLGLAVPAEAVVPAAGWVAPPQETLVGKVLGVKWGGVYGVHSRAASACQT